MRFTHASLYHARFTPAALIIGTPGDDTLTGTSGDDTIDGGLGADLMQGDLGSDTYIVDNVGDIVIESAGGGHDEVRAGIDYTLGDHVERLTLIGSASLDGTGNDAANTLTGNTGRNQLLGSLGNDTLFGGGGFDTLKGGLGNDSLLGSGWDRLYGDGGQDRLILVGDGGIADGGKGNDWIDASGVNPDSVRIVELYGDAGDDTVVGADSHYPEYYGGDGNDLLMSGYNAYFDGGAGNDTLTASSADAKSESVFYGGDGNDLMQGAVGNDAFSDRDEQVDTIDGGEGFDAYTGNWTSSSDALVWSYDDGSLVQTIKGNLLTGIESFNLVLGSGDDVIDLRGLPAAMRSRVSAGAGDDHVYGNTSDSDGSFLDVLDLFGDVGNDTLEAGASDYKLNGDDGRDLIIGNAGDDLCYDWDVDADTYVGGDGTDVFFAAWSDITEDLNWTFSADATTVNGNTLSEFEMLLASSGAGDDYIDARTAQASSLSGNEGNDTLIGGGQAGAEHWFFSSVRVSGEEGNDLLQLFGSAGGSLSGGTGHDTLVGSQAADTLVGGMGNDSMSGGAGADEFIFTAWRTSDTVDDYTSGVDHIHVIQNPVRVGDGDSVIDGKRTIAGPGGFSASAELVIVTTNIAGAITSNSAAAAIGSANGAFQTGRSAIFAVDNGVDSAVYYFRSSGEDAEVSASELSLLATLVGTDSTAAGDYIFRPHA